MDEHCPHCLDKMTIETAFKIQDDRKSCPGCGHEAELDRLREENALLKTRWETHSCALDTIIARLRAKVKAAEEMVSYLKTQILLRVIFSEDEKAEELQEYVKRFEKAGKGKP